MHIPDGFLDPKTAGGLIAAGAGLVAMAYSKVKKLVSVVSMSLAGAGAGNIGKTINQGIGMISGAGGEYLSRLTMIASFIFAAQMFNFPVAEGTSGHLMGGTFAVIFLGPWGGVLAISLVLAVQSVFFADGGLLAIGANIINMAGAGCLLSWYTYKFLNRLINKKSITIFIAAWLSVLSASVLCALELAVSGTYPLPGVLGKMAGSHAIIGMGEGLITLALVIYMNKSLKWKMHDQKE